MKIEKRLAKLERKIYGDRDLYLSIKGLEDMKLWELRVALDEVNYILRLKNFDLIEFEVIAPDEINQEKLISFRFGLLVYNHAELEKIHNYKGGGRHHPPYIRNIDNILPEIKIYIEILMAEKTEKYQEKTESIQEFLAYERGMK